MVKNYINWIRQKIGHEMVILTFSGGILTNDKSEILMQKRSDKNAWGLPGGTIELGESAADTLRREFKEETGLNVKVNHLLGIYSKYFDSYPNGDKAQTITVLYEVSKNEMEQVLDVSNRETLDLEYFSFEKILNEVEIVNQQHKDMIKDYINNQFPVNR